MHVAVGESSNQHLGSNSRALGSGDVDQEIHVRVVEVIFHPMKEGKKILGMIVKLTTFEQEGRQSGIARSFNNARFCAPGFLQANLDNERAQLLPR